MTSSTIYRRLAPYVRPHATRFTLACVCMAASSLFNGASLGLVVPLVDRVFTQTLIPIVPAWPAVVRALAEWLNGVPPATLLKGLALTTFLLLMAKAAFEFLQNFWMNDVSMRVLRDIRTTLYEHLMRQSVGYFTEARTGALMTRVTYDVSVIQNSLTEGLADFVRQVTQILIMTAILFSLDWTLACVSLVLFPAIAYPIVRLGKILRKIAVEVQERMGDINATLVESFSGISVIKVFLLERLRQRTFERQNMAYYKASVRTVKRMAALGAVTELIGTIGGLTVLVVGGQRVMTGQLSPGLFTLFIAAMVSLVQPFKRLSRIHSVNQQAVGAAQRVLEVLDTPPAVQESPGAVALPPFHREVVFDRVGFRYPGSAGPVLAGISVSVPRGELVAIVGPSGAGKTTLVNLLPRLHDPTEGRVLMDGRDLRQATVASLREQIGLVTQETFLFHETVRANIACGNLRADEPAIVAAARAANAHDFIQRLPQGYDTVIGERGAKLSGGERQRIAIARALLRNPPILILDEATSHLDTESERLVQEAIERLTAGRTTLAIAHRLSTVRRADRILVLDHGTIVESGRHDELVGRPGLYRRLCELQFEDLPASPA